MPAQPKETLEKVLGLLGFPSTVEEHKMDDGILLDVKTEDAGRWYPEYFRINFSRCIFCGFCEEACPTNAIQLTPDFEMSEYERPSLVYEKEDLLINGTGKYPGYNFYRVAGLAIPGKDKGEAENERPPVDIHSLLP